MSRAFESNVSRKLSVRSLRGQHVWTLKLKTLFFSGNKQLISSSGRSVELESIVKK